MEPVTSVVDKFKAFAKSSEEFFKDVVRSTTENRCSRNPIEILKRLQREAFSDLMKLRDRQDKVERMLSFYKSSKGGPFQEASTHIKGEVDVVGALLLMENVDEQTCDMLIRAGVRTGVSSKFTFETIVRQKDALVAEFVARHSSQGFHGDVFGSPLALKKVMYLANINDWLSAIAIPVGAQCRDVANASSPLQSRGLTNFSSWAPPLIDQYHGCAAGLIVKGSNVAASLTEFVSWLGTQPNSVGIRRCLSTFGQFMYQPWDGTKLTLMGLHQMPISQPQHIRLDSLTIPISSLRFRAGPATSVGASPSFTRKPTDNISLGSVALMLESELDESMRIGGWVELQKLNPRNLQWAVCLSESPEDEMGWGVSTGGIIERPSTLVHFQMEAFLKFSFGKRFSLQPGIVYTMNERAPALMLHSSWSL
ncbi:uncharacterized protein LOC131243536 [Magnolia sinica]|uniref:uncharacterized protein LOC131243536 n=1 Tax=Magnolia sinica TaxID=86752 RepID=UPI002657CA3C|nr:uncharacterized protein LOC131243536 [Magnolia sinica]